MISNPKKEKRLPKYLNYEDTEKLLNAFDNNNYIGLRNSLILEILYSTGIRVSEITNIKFKDINMSDKTIKITGKGNKERYAYFGTKCKDLIKAYSNKKGITSSWTGIGFSKPISSMARRISSLTPNSSNVFIVCYVIIRGLGVKKCKCPDTTLLALPPRAKHAP